MNGEPRDPDPYEGDTGATGRTPRPARDVDDGFDAPFSDEEPRISFFEEESAVDEPRRAPVEDFGFDDIATDDEPVRGRPSRGAGRRVSSRAARARIPVSSRRAQGGARGSGGGGGGGPRRPRSGGGGRSSAAASPLASPAARIGLAILFAVILIAVVAYVIKDCRRSALVDSYKTYVNSASQVADDSAAQGQSLLTVMQNKDGKTATELQTQIRTLANNAGTIEKRGQDLSPPDGLRDADRNLLTALHLRTTGLSSLADGLPGILRANQKFAVRSITDTMKVFSASDVLYKYQFADPAAAKVRGEGIQGLEVGDSRFLNGANDKYLSEAGATTLLSQLKRDGSSTSTTGTGNRRGTSLIGVVASPSTTLSTSTPTSVVISQSLEWVVTVEDGGDFPENDIEVTATLSYPDGTTSSSKGTIASIESKARATVRIAGPQTDNVQFGQQGTLTVTVAQVSGETNTTNNKASYPITITSG